MGGKINWDLLSPHLLSLEVSCNSQQSIFLHRHYLINLIVTTQDGNCCEGHQNMWCCAVWHWFVLGWCFPFKKGCNRQLMSQSKTRTTSFKDQINMNLPTGRLLNHLRHFKSNHVRYICKNKSMSLTIYGWALLYLISNTNIVQIRRKQTKYKKASKT